MREMVYQLSRSSADAILVVRVYRECVMGKVDEGGERRGFFSFCQNPINPLPPGGTESARVDFNFQELP